MPRQKLTDRTLKTLPIPSAPVRQEDYWDTVLPGFGVRVSFGGRKAFQVMTRIDGRLRRFTIGRYPAMPLAEARERARAVMRDAAAGIDPKERADAERRERERERRNTFRAVAAEYMQHRAKGLRSRAELQRMLDRDILPEWGDRPIKSITRTDVRELLRAKAATAPVMANRLLSLISAIYNWALSEEIVEANPAARMRKPTDEAERERVLSDDEIRAIWSACDRLGYPFGPLYKMLVVTGQRRGEVMTMRWADIRCDLWLIPRERAKSGKGHAVPLSPLALSILEGVPRVGEYVFSSGLPPRNSEPAEPDSEKRHQRGDKPLQGWSKAKARLDAIILADLRTAAEERGEDPEKVKPLPDWRNHDIRRTVATGLRTLGVDRLTVSKVLNHVEAGVTKIYDRYSADPEKRTALEAWGRKLERIMGIEGAGTAVVPLRR